MAKRIKKEKELVVDDRPVMVKVGRHLVDPKDIAAIKGCGKKDLFIIVLKSQPNPEFPMWAKESEIAYLAGMFNILGADE